MESLPQINLKKSFRLTYPRILTHKQAEEYVASKIALERSQFRSYEWDKPRHDPYLHQVASNRIFRRTEKALAARREFAKGEREKLDEQWNDLLLKEQEFKGTFAKMNTFIVSNYEKRLRAIHRAQEDKIIIKKREVEIEEFKKKIDKYLRECADMETKIAEYHLYENFLYEAVSAGTDFKNADDLLDRYEALSRTRNELGRRQDYALKQLENARLRTSKMAEEKGFIILGLNNSIADLRARYSMASRNTLHWESVVGSIRSCIFDRYLELNEVKQSSWNIYCLMCKRKGETPKIAEDDFEKQLLYIKKTLQELIEVKSSTLGSTSSKLKLVKKGKKKRRH